MAVFVNDPDLYAKAWEFTDGLSVGTEINCGLDEHIESGLNRLDIFAAPAVR
jgi:hypothetical protein